MSTTTLQERMQRVIRQDIQSMHGYAVQPSAGMVKVDTMENPFRLPLNLRITGTVNVDESSHTLSDKLLDRANVIELTDVDLAAFRKAGDKAYEALKIQDAKNQVHKEIGKP